jgi:diguanylate cyclase (GGDEF)-like protein/PAS domain S-box-containing protein
MQFTPYALPLLISAVVCSVLAVYLWERRSTPGARPFSLVMAAAAAWALFDLLEITTEAFSTKLAFHNLEFIPALFIPVGWVIFTAEFTGKAAWLKPRVLAVLLVIPILTLLILEIRPLSHLVQPQVRVATGNVVIYPLEEHGWWFWISVAYSSVLILLGIIDLLQWRSYSPRWYVRQVTILSISILLPWLGYLLGAFDAAPLPFLDFAPILFAFSGVLITLGAMRFSLLDIMPMARASVIESMRDGVIIFDDQARVVDLNASAASMLGISPSQAIGQPVYSALAQFPQAVSMYQAETESRLSASLFASDSVRFFDIRIAPLYDIHSHRAGRLVELREITDQKQDELELEKSHALLLATLEAAADGILVSTGRDQAPRYNRRFIEMWRMPETASGSPDEQQIMAFLVDQLINPAAFYRLINKLTTQMDAESYDVLELKDGRMIERYSRPLRIAEKRAGRVWSFRDITEQRRSEERLRWMSTHDILTGLYNRVYFEEEINRLEKGRQFPVSMIMADVDGLKETNDVYGHQAGDGLLRQAAEVLRQACRAEDMVARIGGDEFGILLPLSPNTVAENCIERIKNMITMAGVGDQGDTISLSLGSATAENGESLRRVLRQADEAMYKVKVAKHKKRGQAGPGRTDPYHPEAPLN